MDDKLVCKPIRVGLTNMLGVFFFWTCKMAWAELDDDGGGNGSDAICLVSYDARMSRDHVRISKKNFFHITTKVLFQLLFSHLIFFSNLFYHISILLY